MKSYEPGRIGIYENTDEYRRVQTQNIDLCPVHAQMEQITIKIFNRLDVRKQQNYEIKEVRTQVPLQLKIKTKLVNRVSFYIDLKKFVITSSKNFFFNFSFETNF